MGKRIEEGPRLRSLDEIDMGLVREAREIKAENNWVPISPQAIELVRYLRATGAFDGQDYRNMHDEEETASTAA